MRLRDSCRYKDKQAEQYKKMSFPASSKRFRGDNPSGKGEKHRGAPNSSAGHNIQQQQQRPKCETEAAASTADADYVITLNVGGTIITTLKSTLCSTPSRLAEWAETNFPNIPRDSKGRPFIDRDATSFSHILDYLRGYGLPSKSDDLVVVAEDATFYEMESLKHEVGLDPPSTWQFAPGPGVQESGMEFSTSDIVGICGTEPLATGLVHTMVFRVDKCELVSIGVVAFEGVHYDAQLRHQKQSLSYSNTGEFVQNWSDEPIYEAGVPYKNSDEITVRVRFAQPGGPPLEAERTNHGILPAPPSLQRTAATHAAGRVAMRAVYLPRVLSGLVEPVIPTLASPPEPSTTLSGAGVGASGTSGEEAMAVVSTAPMSPVILAPENRDASIGALVVFMKGDHEVCQALWPAPVPPLQFAVSLQGTSAVTIIKTSSESPADTQVSAADTTEHSPE